MSLSWSPTTTAWRLRWSVDDLGFVRNH